jgi:hypothetical protein
MRTEADKILFVIKQFDFSQSHHPFIALERYSFFGTRFPTANPSILRRETPSFIAREPV